MDNSPTKSHHTSKDVCRVTDNYSVSERVTVLRQNDQPHFVEYLYSSLAITQSIAAWSFFGPFLVVVQLVLEVKQRG